VVYVVVILGIVARYCGLSLFALMRYLKAELLIALSTWSSEAVLPQLVRKLEHLGVGNPLSGWSYRPGSRSTWTGRRCT
jgi:aerobic C4-dicarboxylate transport protein